MKKIHYIFVYVFLVSCTSNTIYEKPKDLIPKDTMVNILTDLFLASSATNVKNKNLESSANYTPIVYEKYNIDSTRFKNSNIYYLSKMDEYEKLFLKVKDSLKYLQRVYRIKEDSIKKLREEKIKSLDPRDRKTKGANSLKNKSKLLLKKKR